MAEVDKLDLSKNLFGRNHLKQIHAGYWEHLALGMQCNMLALVSFITGMIHTIFPFLLPFFPIIMTHKIVKLSEEAYRKINVRHHKKQ